MNRRNFLERTMAAIAAFFVPTAYSRPTPHQRLMEYRLMTEQEKLDLFNRAYPAVPHTRVTKDQVRAARLLFEKSPKSSAEFNRAAIAWREQHNG